MNHCDVARKITGLWQRQQCGYECWNASRCHSRPRAFSASTIDRIGVEHALAAEELDRLEEVAARSDRRVDLEPVLHAGGEVVAAMARRGVHGAGALLERDVLREHADRIARVERMLKAQMCSSSAPFILAIGAPSALAGGLRHALRRALPRRSRRGRPRRTRRSRSRDGTRSRGSTESSRASSSR